MRCRIEALAERLEEFVSEDGHDALVIAGDDRVGALVGAAVDLLEQRGSIDVSIPFFDGFQSTDAFAERVMAHLDALTEQAGLERTPRDAQRPSLERMLDALIAFARTVRARGDVRVAVWLCPAAIADVGAYLAVARALIDGARRCDPPLRIAAREPSDDGVLGSALRRAAIPSLTVALDMSTRAVRDALADDAADPAGDPAARAAALMSVAMADAVDGRAEDALAVLVTLAGVFESLGDASPRALTFVLVGNVLLALGRIAEARTCVSQGLALAVEARAFPVLVAGGMLAGLLSMRAGDPVDADVRFDVVARLAARLGSPQIVAEALLERGKALEARAMMREACDAWICAAEAARRAQLATQERSAWAAVARVYRDAGMSSELAPIERRLTLLDTAAHTSCSHEHAS